MTVERAHAVLSASGSKKWMACTMSVAVESTFPDEDSDFAREGTYAHGLAELMLRCYLSGNQAADVGAVCAYVTPDLNPDAGEFFTDALDAHVQTYVDFVVDKYEELVKEHGADNVQMILEQKVNFSEWVPEGFGRCDVILIAPGLIWPIDLKFGQGVHVHGAGNPQLRLYALGAYACYSVLYDFDRVACTIVQPRMDNISGEVMEVSELLEWAEQVVAPRARIAWAAYQGDRSVARYAPGEHCVTGFCKARFRCNARARYMLESAQMPYAMSEPDTLTVEELESVVDKARLAVRWLQDCERFLVSQAAAGKLQMRQHEIVEGRSWREIKDVTKAAQILMHNGFKASDIYEEPRLKGVVVLEKLVGRKQFSELLADVIEKPPGKPSLVPLGSGRKVVQPAQPTPVQDAQDAFGDLED